MTQKVLLMIALYFAAMGIYSYRVNLANQDYIDCTYTKKGGPVCSLVSWEPCLNYSLPCAWFDGKHQAFRVYLSGNDYLACDIGRKDIKCRVVHKNPCETIDGLEYTTSLCKRPVPPRR